MHQNPNVTAGIIFLVSEVVREKPDLSTLMTHLMGPPNSSDESGGGGDDQKDCLEVPTDNDFSEVKQFGAKTKTKGGVYVSMKIESKSNICLREDAQGKVSGEGSSDDPATAEATQIPTTTSSSNMKLPDNNSRTSHQTSYDPYHRNPLYSGSQNTSLWELRQLEVCECDFYFPYLFLDNYCSSWKEGITCPSQILVSGYIIFHLLQLNPWIPSYYLILYTYI